MAFKEEPLSLKEIMILVTMQSYMYKVSENYVELCSDS